MKSKRPPCPSTATTKKRLELLNGNVIPAGVKVRAGFSGGQSAEFDPAKGWSGYLNAVWQNGTETVEANWVPAECLLLHSPRFPLLDVMTMEELRRFAREYNITPGRLKRRDLIEHIRKTAP